MKDRAGRVKIPGFYDDVVPLRDEERAGVREAAVQREEIQAGAWRPAAAGRGRLHHARTDLGAPDVRSERAARRLHRRRREDGDCRHLDGEGQHAARAEPGSEEDRRPVRGVREKGHAENGRTESHADARRQAVDDGVRQPFRPGRRPRDRAGLRPDVPSSRAKAARFQWSPRSRKSSGCRACCSASACPDENAHAPDEKLDLGNFHNGIVASAYLYKEIGALS